MTPATSASDRYAAAKAALAEYDASEAVNNPYETAETLAETLRALITPPEMAETPKQIAARVGLEFAEREPFIAAHFGPVARHIKALLIAAVHAGIQAAWESWESDDYAPTLCEKCGADA